MKLSWFSVIIAAAWLGAPVNGAKIDEHYDPLMGFAKWEKSQPLALAVALQTVDSASKITIYEGLPHQMFEARSFRREAERADVLWVHDVPFYQKPLEVTPEDLKRATAVYHAAESHQNFSGPKLCGGFHPDYYIVWSKGSKWVGAMICLGCGEWISLNKDGYRYEDISKEAHAQLKEMLQKYVSLRPKPDPSYERAVLIPPPTLEGVKK